MWIGLLFSIMSMSAFLQQYDIEAAGKSLQDTRNSLETFRSLTIHCLVAANYVETGRYTIETLAIHFAVDQNMNIDTEFGNWLLIGVIVRLAMRMGLHRDPSHWPRIQPMQAEMRRRIWVALYQMDFFTSTQVGLPRIIKDSQCDACLPVFSYKCNIEPETSQNQREVALTYYTPIMHIVQRHKVIKVAAEIYDATETAPAVPARTAALAAKLDRAVDTIPEHFKYKPFELSIGESPINILHRILLDILIHKAVYLLHRRSFVNSFNGTEISQPTELCIKSALAILDHHRRMDEESQPGGVMFSIRWKLATSLNHEFLQATMILCFALTQFRLKNIDKVHSLACVLSNEASKALIGAKEVWDKTAHRSVEAQTAAKAIAEVLAPCLDSSYVYPGIGSEGKLWPARPTSAIILLMRRDVTVIFDLIEPPDQWTDFIDGHSALEPWLFSADEDVRAYGDATTDFLPEE